MIFTIITHDPDSPNRIRFEPTDRDEKRAMKNHRQTLARINDRGGLSWSEFAAVVEDREWRPLPNGAAIRAVEAEFYLRGEPQRKADRLMEFARAHLPIEMRGDDDNT